MGTDSWPYTYYHSIPNLHTDRDKPESVSRKGGLQMKAGKMRKNVMRSKTKNAKNSKAYATLSDEAKVIYDYCLEIGADGKPFELDYDKFIVWLTNKRK